MRKQPSVTNRILSIAASRFGAWLSLGVTSDDRPPAKSRGLGAGIVPLVGLTWLATASIAQAQNVIDDVNNAMLTIIQNTSASLIDGPPEVANEIAMVDGAMYDAVNAATGLTYAPLNYTGGAVAGVNASAAALQAAVTVMNNLYGAGSLYQQYAGVTAASYYGVNCSSGPGPCAASPNANYTGLVGPSAAQMTRIDGQITNLTTELAGLLTVTSASTALGNAAATATIAANNASGSQAAMLATLTPYVPAGSGSVAGVYVPPTGRPALQPTWGTVAPIGISSSQLTTIEGSIPAALASTPAGLTSPNYANQVLQTECEGSSTPLNIAPTSGGTSTIEAACAAAGFLPESAALAQAALFWNDPGSTIQPPGHWLQIADTVTAGQNLSLLQTARADALAGIAMDDAGIAAWDVKYANNAWRPITAIKDCASWNTNFTTCDSGWNSLINTPPHPDYVAGHPAFSGAAATALAAALGTDSVTFTSTSNTYCNSGTATLDSDGAVIGCTDSNSKFWSVSGAGCDGGGAVQYDSDGNIIGCMLGGTFTAQSSGSCASGSVTEYDSGGNQTGCLTGGTPTSMAGGAVGGAGCNNADSQPVLLSDGSANPAYNNSPLICEIAETFDSLSEASSGYLGAEFSRVVGGIHTPDAVTEALVIGNEVGTLVASEDLPEPPLAPTLAASLLILAGLRHWRRTRRLASNVV